MTCAERSKARIEYHGEKDFWKFYLANRSEIDHIIEVQAQKFAWFIEPREMIQEVLIDLHEHDVLGKFNPAKSHITTYLYGRIFGYIMHVAKSYSRQWMPCSKGKDIQRKAIVSNRVLVGFLNGLNDQQSNNYPSNDYRWGLSRLSSRTEEDELTAKFILEELVEQLTPEDREVLKYWQQELSHKQIAKKVGCSPSSVSGRMARIRELLRRLTK